MMTFSYETMEELLTAKQVQDTLKVDRTTIYRMLKDGRLKGVKVGNQWRFQASEVQMMLSGGHHLPVEVMPLSSDILPWRYVQSAQDVFAEIAEIGSVITDSQGMPLTRMSNSCDFCNLILASEKGSQACLRSWQQLANQSSIGPEFTGCHAGLQYARARIAVCGETIALLVAGQFYSEETDPAETGKRIEALAQEYQLDPRLLWMAASRVRVLDQRTVNEITNWLLRMARTFEQFGMERAEMISRLHHIAEVSHLE
jgi:excisionase family DNA binding protein